MKVYNCENLIVDIPLDITCLNFDEIIDDGLTVLVPYENNDFLVAARDLFDDVIKESGVSWKNIDYKKSKVYFYISNEIYLSIEAFPRYYSAEEKQSLLQFASQEEMDDGWSEYLKLMNMFDDIDAILNDSFPVGEVGTYQVELTNEERASLCVLLK